MKIVNEKQLGRVENDSELMDLILECAADLTRIGYRFDDDLKFELATNIRSFGTCDPPRREHPYKWVISINTNHLNDSEESVKNTIYHELAHYLTEKQLVAQGRLKINEYGRLVYPPQCTYRGHGTEWKAIANRISSRLNLKTPITRTSEIEQGSDMLKNKKYIFTCKECGWNCGYMKRAWAVSEYEINGSRNLQCPKCKKFNTLELKYN